MDIARRLRFHVLSARSAERYSQPSPMPEFTSSVSHVHGQSPAIPDPCFTARAQSSLDPNLFVPRLCQAQSLVALRKCSTIYACSHVSIVRLVQSIILVSRDFHSHSSPLYHLPGELVSLSSVPMPSIDLNLWNLSRPSAFVPVSLGFTSVLTDDIVKSFRKPNLE